jgi:hypothetical protein
MCAPRKALIPLLIAGGLAVATGGVSLGATATTAASTTASTAALASEVSYVGASSTLSSISSALSTGLKYANLASPIIGATGLIYSGQIQKGIYEQQAAMAKFQAQNEEDTYVLRKDQRRRQLAIALGKQRALYGVTGVDLANTPTDVLSQTSRNFAYDDYVDRFNTAGKITSYGLSAENMQASGRVSQFGGLLNAGITLGRRGTV